MKREPLVVVGMAAAILGYGLVYAAWTKLHPEVSPTGEAVGVLDALTPGTLHASTTPAPGAATRAAVTKGGGGGAGRRQ